MKKHLVFTLFFVSLILISCEKDSNNNESRGNQNTNQRTGDGSSRDYIMYKEDSTIKLYNCKPANGSYSIYNGNDTIYTIIKEGDSYRMYEKSSGLVQYTIKKSDGSYTIYDGDSSNTLYKSVVTASLCWLYTTIDDPATTFLITYYDGLYRVYHKEVDCPELLYTIKHVSNDDGFSDGEYIAIMSLALSGYIKSHGEDDICYCEE